MSSLHDIVRRHIESELLSNLATDILPEHREAVLETFRRSGVITQKVNQIVNAYVEEATETSSKVKKRKLWKISFTILSTALTILIGYTVNQEYWGVVWALGGISILFSSIFVFLED